MKTLYFDCFGGISGDMVMGALMDIGVSLDYILSQLRSLDLGGYSLRTYQSMSHGIRGIRFEVEVDEEQHHHRTYVDIARMIEKSELEANVKRTALCIFEKLALAEAKVHGVEPLQVHFHEVGAVDSIIDIVGFAIALDFLGIEKIYCSPLPTGYGCIRTMHGLLPIPAPATMELLKGIPLRRVGIEGELVTPTGAAIIATLAEDFGPIPTMQIVEVGYGVGNKDYGIPNFLRVFVGETI